MRILVVDDDSGFVSTQADWLKAEGHRVIEARSERDARKCLAENEDIDIALIDMYMETTDSGLKLVRLIRGSYPQIVPIVITGYADYGDAAMCMEEGCFSYIVKGETPPNMIRQTLRKAAAHHQLIAAVPRLRFGLGELKSLFAELTMRIERVSSSLVRIEDELTLLDAQGEDTVSGPSEEGDSGDG